MLIGELSGIGSAMAWAITGIVMKMLSGRASAPVVNGLRCAISLLLFLTALVVVEGRFADLWRLPLLPVALVLLSGFIGVGVGDALFIRSMNIIGAARAMPISGSYPLFTLFLAILFVGEGLTVRLAAGTVLTVIGVSTLALPAGVGWKGMRGLLRGRERAGLLLTLFTAFCWAISTTVLKGGLDGLDGLVANVLRMAMASISLLAIAGALGGDNLTLKRTDRRWFAWLILAGALGTVSSMLFVPSVQYAGAAKAAALSSTAPLFGLPLAIYMGERVNLRLVLGTLVTIAGIWLLLL
jgi:drug/metabolite transporter (DMT)-like permease